MKLKQLECALSNVESFKQPKIELEQYLTSSHIAARMVFSADSKFGDIQGRAILDLGCGTGMLAFAAELIGSSFTVGFDIDPEALETATSNAEELESDVEFILGNVSNLSGFPFPDKSFDTVLMNPPFGTRNKGADICFLEAGLRAARNAVYSMHKSSTREFIKRKAEREWNANFELIAQLRFDIKQSYKFHKKKTADIEVDLVRLAFKSE